MDLFKIFKPKQSSSIEEQVSKESVNKRHELAQKEQLLSSKLQYENERKRQEELERALEQQELTEFIDYLAIEKKFLMEDFRPYEYDLSNKKALMELLESEEQISDYPESKQKKLQAAVSTFVKDHLSEGAGYDKDYGYNASFENYTENGSVIKMGFIDDSDHPYIKATINKETGNADFNYIGRYQDLLKPEFKESLNVTTIISARTRPRQRALELER